MASKKTAAIITVVGGVFYIIGGALIAAALELLGSGFGGANACSLLGAGSLCGSNTNTTIPDLGNLLGPGSGGIDMGGIAAALLAIGLITGGMIILGGWLINSEDSGKRKIGIVLAVVGALVGSLTTLGGLGIGFILTAIGVYLAFTYGRGGRGMVIGLGPVGSVTLGPQGAAGAVSSIPAGSGPLNYCTKCGSQIRPDSVFCGACGARLAE